MNYLYLKFKPKLIQFGLVIDWYQSKDENGFDIYQRYFLNFNQLVSPNEKREVFNFILNNENDKPQSFDILKVIEGVYYKFKIMNATNQSRITLTYKEYTSRNLNPKNYFIITSVQPFRYITLQLKKQTIDRQHNYGEIALNYAYPYKIYSFPIIINLKRIFPVFLIFKIGRIFNK